MKRRGLIRLAGSFLALLTALTAFSACSDVREIGKNIAARIDHEETPVSSGEIVRLMVTAVNDEEDVPGSYQDIPEPQRDGLSYSEYTEYIDIMRGLIVQNEGDKKVESFVILDEDRSLELTDGIGTKGGKLICAQLLFEENDGDPVYLVFRKANDGSVTLASDWVRGVISISNYGNHYFSMLESNNIEGIYTLLRPSYGDEGPGDDVIRAKAAALSDFYSIKVKSSVSQYLIEKLTSNEIVYNIPKTVSDDSETMVSHHVAIRVSDDDYIIEDKINQESDPSLIMITNGKNGRIAYCGYNYSSFTVENNMGKPRMTLKGTQSLGSRTDANGNEKFIHTTVLNYDGLLQTYEAIDISEGTWSGVLRKIMLVGESDFYIGDGIRVGMKRSELLGRYPFLDDLDYKMEIKTINGNFEVDFEFEDDSPEAPIIRIFVKCV